MIVKTMKVQAAFPGGHGFSRMPLRGCGEAPHLCINWTSSAVIGEGVFLTSSSLKTSVARVVSSDRRSLTGDKDKEKTEGKKNQGVKKRSIGQKMWVMTVMESCLDKQHGHTVVSVASEQDGAGFKAELTSRGLSATQPQSHWRTELLFTATRRRPKPNYCRPELVVLAKCKNHTKKLIFNNLFVLEVYIAQNF